MRRADLDALHALGRPDRDPADADQVISSSAHDNRVVGRRGAGPVGHRPAEDRAEARR